MAASEPADPTPWLEGGDLLPRLRRRGRDGLSRLGRAVLSPRRAVGVTVRAVGMSCVLDVTDPANVQQAEQAAAIGSGLRVFDDEPARSVRPAGATPDALSPGRG